MITRLTEKSDSIELPLALRIAASFSLWIRIVQNPELCPTRLGIWAKAQKKAAVHALKSVAIQTKAEGNLKPLFRHPHDFMPELNDFYNDGFGWICRHCEHNLKNANSGDGLSRIMREGEAESKKLELSNTALAKWADAARRTLICPHCGITELADIS